MTPEQIEPLIAGKDPAALVAAFAPLDEPQRHALWPAVEACKKRTFERLGADQRDWLRRIEMCQLACAAVGPRDEVFQLEVGTGSDTDAQVFVAFGKLLADRRPPWLDALVARGVSLESLLPLVDAGCVTDLTSDGVVLSLSYWMTPAAGRLAERPELLDAVYRLFAVDSRILDYYNGGEAAESGWPRTILDLCDRGQLDRTRMMREIMEAFGYDFNNLAVKGLMVFHDQVAANAACRQPLEAEYLGLLGSSSTAFVGFGLAQLKTLSRAKLLDGDAYVRNLPRVFQCPARSHPKTALALLKTAVKQQRTLRRAAAAAAAEGLGHGHEDVQEAALKLVEELVQPGDHEVGEILARHREHAAAPVQQRLDPLAAQWRAAAGGDTARESGEPSRAADGSRAGGWSGELAERQARADALPEPLRRRLGLPQILAACWEGACSAPTTWDLRAAPLRRTLEPISPIESADELFDAVARGIETMDSGDEVERILDGISRLCDQRPGDFDGRAAPIVHRIGKTLNAANSSPGLLAQSCDRGVVRVLMAWLAGNARRAKFSAVFGTDSNWRSFMIQRLRALSERVEQRVAAPLLAAPTHRGGWIDPVVWAGRFVTLAERGIDIPQRDLIQSFLRLTPDGRAAALERVQQVDSPYRHAAAWALGADEQVTTSGERPDVWIAASRCRDPDMRIANSWPDESLEAPDLVEPGVYRWRPARGVRNVYNGRILIRDDAEATEPAIAFDLAPGFGRCDVARYPTALSHLLDPGFHPKWVIEWSAMVWPARPDGYWACAVDALLRRFNMKPSALEPHSVYLHPLVEPDRPLTELSALALWIGSLSKDSDARTAAIDAWTALVGDGRGDTRLLGSVLVRLAAGGWLPLNRLAETLRDVARSSPLHAWTVLEVLQDLVASMKELPHDAHHVIQLLRELLVQLGLGARGALKPLLAASEGAGKSAKLARQVVALADASQHAERQSALRALIDARLARAARWMH